jgi:Flp pilus assembly protein TadG
MAQLFLLVCFPLFVALCAVAVDVGRMYLAKAELQAAVDAAARYAARGMQMSSTPLSTAFVHASAVAAESKVDGSPPTLLAGDVVRGTFNPATRTFVPDGVGDAVSVTFHQTFNRPGSVPLIVSSLVGGQPKTISATAVARVNSISQEIQPPASGNLWLSGMPDNTTTQNSALTTPPSGTTPARTLTPSSARSRSPWAA